MDLLVGFYLSEGPFEQVCNVPSPGAEVSHEPVIRSLRQSLFLQGCLEMPTSSASDNQAGFPLAAPIPFLAPHGRFLSKWPIIPADHVCLEFCWGKRMSDPASDMWIVHLGDLVPLETHHAIGTIHQIFSASSSQLTRLSRMPILSHLNHAAISTLFWAPWYYNQPHFMEQTNN